MFLMKTQISFHWYEFQPIRFQHYDQNFKIAKHSVFEPYNRKIMSLDIRLVSLYGIEITMVRWRVTEPNILLAKKNSFPDFRKENFVPR